MQKVLVVVDMQNDFIDGALGTKEAVAIVPGVKEKIENFDGVVLFTRDTHETYYLDTQEGKKLPVPHCIRDTEGWQIRSELDALRKTEPIDKETFGSTTLAGELQMLDEDQGIESITFDLIAAKERELTKITRYKQFLYQDWKDGEITQQEYRDMKADYERQTSDISAVLTRLNAERAELANGVDNEHPALVAFMKYQNIEALNREILVELVDYIKVYENGNISVKFKFADELRKIAEYIEINTTEDTAVAG